MASLYSVARAGPGLPSSSTTDTEGFGLGTWSTERQKKMDPTADCVMSRSPPQQTAAEDDVETLRTVNNCLMSPALVNGGSQLPQMWYEQENNAATHLPRASRSALSCVEQSALRHPETGSSPHQLHFQDGMGSSSAPPDAGCELSASKPSNTTEETNGVMYWSHGVRPPQNGDGPVSHLPNRPVWQSNTDQLVGDSQHQANDVLQTVHLQEEEPSHEEAATRLLPRCGIQMSKTSQGGVHVTDWEIPTACPPVARSHENEHQLSGMYLGPHCYSAGAQAEYNCATASGEEDSRRQPSMQPHQAPKVVYVPIPLKLKRPAPFDGEGSWEDYLVKFELLSKINNWNDHTKALELATSLKGQALQVLTELQPQQRESYVALVAALTARFDPSNVTELYRAKLKERVRGENETLPELAHDIQYLTRKAYPSMDTHAREHLILEKFIESLSDLELEWYVFQSKPQNINRALELALENEAFKQAQTRKIDYSHLPGLCQESTFEKNQHWCRDVPDCGSHGAIPCNLPCSSGQVSKLKRVREKPSRCA